jgi:hypothetical protein
MNLSMHKVFAFRMAAWFLGLLVLAPLALGAADGATITYRRVFQGSSPELIEIKLNEDGTASFDIRQLAEDADPQVLSVGPVVRGKIFQLADRLNNFEGKDLDVHRRMAALGQKTFRYEKGAAVHETQYNYTLDNDAGQLAMIFEGLARQQQNLTELNRKLRYDHLGVNDALRQFENDLDRRVLPEPELLLPVLDRIVADSRLLEIARRRAAALAQRIRNSPAN